MCSTSRAREGSSARSNDRRREQAQGDTRRLAAQIRLRHAGGGWRTDWLLEFVDAPEKPAFYKDALLAEMLNFEEEGFEARDRDQWCELAHRLAERSETVATRALYEVFNRTGSGAEEIIHLDNESGLIHAASAFGRTGIETYPDSLVALAETLGFEEPPQAAQELPAVREFIDECDEFKKAWRGPTEPRPPDPVDEILANASAAKGQLPGRYQCLRAKGFWRRSRKRS